MNYKKFATEHKITMKCTQTDSNPSMSDSHGMDHWKCSLRRGAKRMSLVFSMGSGHHGAEPTFYEVLESLAMDASGAENARDFEDWCSEYGYDCDSRSAHKIWKSVDKQAKKLKAFLGSELYDDLLYNHHTEE